MTELELRTRFVDLARSFYGTVEGSVKHKSILDTYNRHQPLARGYKVKETDAWCATFVSAMAILCGLTEIMPTECSCAKMVALHKVLGTWSEDDTVEPRPGDLILYDWDDSGEGDCVGHPDHIGIVVRVRDGVIRVIEGNCSNKVWHRDIAVDARCIRGYCLPDFARVAEADDPTDAEVTGFVDVPQGAWYADSVAYCAAHGLMEGKGDGVFDPDGLVTRKELAAVAARLRKSLTA